MASPFFIQVFAASERNAKHRNRSRAAAAAETLPRVAWTPADGRSVGDAFLAAHGHLNEDRSVNPFGLFKV